MLAITCPPLSPPNDGEKVCTDSENYESVCTFSCNEGFSLVGEEQLTCIDDGGTTDGRWDNGAPTCQGIVSCNPDFVGLFKFLTYCLF